VEDPVSYIKYCTNPYCLFSDQHVQKVGLAGIDAGLRERDDDSKERELLDRLCDPPRAEAARPPDFLSPVQASMEEHDNRQWRYFDIGSGLEGVA
jgi:hypothetical protein